MTAQERDNDATGLDFFQARYHGSGQGRFLSADSLGNLVANPADPQTWNQYAYVRNNPLAFSDPSGHECVWDNGSYDSADDPETSSISGCTAAGGTWFDPSTFEAPNGDWSAQPDQQLADYIATEPDITFQTQASAYGQILSADVAIAQSVGNLFNSYGPIFGFAMKTDFLYQTTRTGAVWDFKNQPAPYASPELEPFGNCHFGAVGKAIGLPDSWTRWAAGANSWYKITMAWYTVNEKWGRPWSSIGGGDNPQNQLDIARGQQTGSCTP